MDPYVRAYVNVEMKCPTMHDRYTNYRPITGFISVYSTREVSQTSAAETQQAQQRTRGNACNAIMGSCIIGSPVPGQRVRPRKVPEFLSAQLPAAPSKAESEPGLV